MMKLLAIRLSDKPGNVIKYIRGDFCQVKFSIGDRIFIIATPINLRNNICWVSEVKYTGNNSYPSGWMACNNGYERLRLKLFWRNDWNLKIMEFIA